MEMIWRIKELTMRYGSTSYKAIGEFILKEYDHLYEYTIQDIAQRTYTSKSALVRFAKAMGYSGWKEFLKACIDELRYQEAHYTDIDPNYPFTAASSDKDIVTKLCSLQIESILDTTDLMDYNALRKTVEMLRVARRIALFCSDYNPFMGELFAGKMLSIGRHVEIPTQGEGRMLAGSLCRDDIAIVLSYSGELSGFDPISAVTVLEEIGVPILAITGLGDSYLRQHASRTMTISSHERLYNKISNFSTETSLLLILNTLFSCYFARDYTVNVQQKNKIDLLMNSQLAAPAPDAQGDSSELS